MNKALMVMLAAVAAGLAIVHAAGQDAGPQSRRVGVEDLSPPAKADVEREVRTRGYAVADLERVANEIGANFQYRMTLEDYRARRQQKLNEEAAALKKELDELAGQLRAEQDAAKRAVLEQDIRRRQARAAALLAQARTELADFDRRIKQTFRKGIQPAIDKVCRAHGAAMMIARGNDLLFAVPSLDLTDALVAELKAHPVDLPEIPLEEPPTTQPE